MQDHEGTQHMEEAPRESEVKYRTIFENTGNPMMVINEDNGRHPAPLRTLTPLPFTRGIPQTATTAAISSRSG
jgi:hypothetical protein